MSHKNKKQKFLDQYRQIISTLSFQTEDGSLIKLADHFICPLCLNVFNLKELGDDVNNILTIEDVPPKGLGGSPILITCRDCNSSCGHNLDVFLINEMHYKDERFDFSKPKSTVLAFNGIKIHTKIMGPTSQLTQTPFCE